MGIFVFIAGLIITWFSLSGQILVLIGAFFGFTSTGSSIDFDKKRIKFLNSLFGIIKVGKWFDIEPDMRLGIKKSNIRWRAYSRTNRIINIPQKDCRVVLYDSDNNPIMDIKKLDSEELADEELKELSAKLGLKSR